MNSRLTRSEEWASIGRGLEELHGYRDFDPSVARRFFDDDLPSARDPLTGGAPSPGKAITFNRPTAA